LPAGGVAGRAQPGRAGAISSVLVAQRILHNEVLPDEFLLRSVKRQYQSVERRAKLRGSQVLALSEITANPDIGSATRASSGKGSPKPEARHPAATRRKPAKP
jgi:hypothetical protein